MRQSEEKEPGYPSRRIVYLRRKHQEATAQLDRPKLRNSWLPKAQAVQQDRKREEGPEHPSRGNSAARYNPAMMHPPRELKEPTTQLGRPKLSRWLPRQAGALYFLDLLHIMISIAQRKREKKNNREKKMGKVHAVIPYSVQH